jgi:hypothetical protein
MLCLVVSRLSREGGEGAGAGKHVRAHRLDQGVLIPHLHSKQGGLEGEEGRGKGAVRLVS